ncbi:hypothetical protein OH77DRAFT_1423500 [Trametes cingulata]|nr:hypothetical protein OH77DRAFT_1423500 [Trametes cingulata]
MIASYAFLLAALFAVVPREVSGQGTTAYCSAGYEWMSNSKGQSPCLISSYLFTPCSSQTASWVFPLSPGFHYNTPQNNPTSATPCRCNTVLYSMIAACSTCQGQGAFVVPWSLYAENCSTVYVNNYPEGIPVGTAVPAWAYLDITTTNRFDPVAAEALVNQGAPESTPSSNSPTAGTVLTNAPSATSTAIGAPQSPDSNTDSPSSSKKSNNLGAIVGGAVSGGVGLIAIGLVLFFWLRRRREMARDTPTGPVDLTGPEYGGTVEKLAGGEYAAVPPPIPSPKLYDPDDPSTFPESPDAHADSSNGSTTAYTTSPVHVVAPALPYAYPAPDVRQSVVGPGASAGYKGVPEL